MAKWNKRYEKTLRNFPIGYINIVLILFWLCPMNISYLWMKQVNLARFLLKLPKSDRLPGDRLEASLDLSKCNHLFSSDNA